jgi:tRNA A37 threonylcarbamoyladenosine dehydratase
MYECYRQDSVTRTTGAFIHFTGVGSAGSAARSALARAPQLSFGLQY